jgi:hypothetical protein
VPSPENVPAAHGSHDCWFVVGIVPAAHNGTLTLSVTGITSWYDTKAQPTDAT